MADEARRSTGYFRNRRLPPPSVRSGSGIKANLFVSSPDRFATLVPVRFANVSNGEHVNDRPFILSRW